MFWDATVGGLSHLLDWQVYGAGIIFIALSMGPLLVIGLAMSASGRAAGAVGCVSMLFVPFLQTFALLVFVLTLSPVLLGLSKSAAWAFPWQLLAENPGGMALVVAKLLLVALVLAFVPILGRMQSLHTLLLGSFALAMIVGVLEVNKLGRSVNMWPGMWFVLGLLVVGSALAWLGMIVAGVLAVAVDAWSEGWGQLIALPVGATFGFIPLFIYSSWLAGQVRAG